MKIITSIAAAALLAICSAASASAQSSPTWSDAAVRPMEITCDDLAKSGDAERENMLFFIAGYQAAMEQAGHGIPSGKMTGVDTSDTAPEAAAAAAASDTAATTDATAADAAATSAVADTAAAGAGGTSGSRSGEVTLARAFFSMPAADVLAACKDSGGTSAAEVIRNAQGSAR